MHQLRHCRCPDPNEELELADADDEPPAPELDELEELEEPAEPGVGIRCRAPGAIGGGAAPEVEADEAPAALDPPVAPCASTALPAALPTITSIRVAHLTARIAHSLLTCCQR
jgi:hypothetical protein